MHFEIQHLLHTKTVNKIQWLQFNADVSHWKFPAIERESHGLARAALLCALLELAFVSLINKRRQNVGFTAWLFFGEYM